MNINCIDLHIPLLRDRLEIYIDVFYIWNLRKSHGGEFEVIGHLKQVYVTVKFCYKDHSKLWPPWLLRPLVLIPKYNLQIYNVNGSH